MLGAPRNGHCAVNPFTMLRMVSIPTGRFRYCSKLSQRQKDKWMKMCCLRENEAPADPDMPNGEEGSRVSKLRLAEGRLIKVLLSLDRPPLRVVQGEELSSAVRISRLPKSPVRQRKVAKCILQPFVQIWASINLGICCSHSPFDGRCLGLLPNHSRQTKLAIFATASEMEGRSVAG